MKLNICGLKADDRGRLHIKAEPITSTEENLNRCSERVDGSAAREARFPGVQTPQKNCKAKIIASISSMGFASYTRRECVNVVTSTPQLERR